LNLEARALAAVSGVKVERRGQGGASNTLSAAHAGHRRHMIARGLIALLGRLIRLSECEGDWLDSVSRVGHTGRMNVTLTPALEEFVRRKVESGDFRSPDEVVFEGLRLLQQQDEQWNAEARAKIDEGWNQTKAGQLRSPEAIRENLIIGHEPEAGGRGPWQAA